MYNYVGSQEFVISSDVEVPEGTVEVRFEFEPKGKPDVKKGKGAPGKAQLYINGKLVGEGKLPVTIPLAFGLGGGLVVGRGTGSPISSRFKNPFEFTGTIHERGDRRLWRTDCRQRVGDARRDGAPVGAA